MKHTKGPWNLIQSGSEIGVRIGISGGFILHPLIDNRLENAQLISAAPDLFAALKAMLTHMGMDEDESNKSILAQARAALNKATGVKP